MVLLKTNQSEGLSTGRDDLRLTGIAALSIRFRVLKQLTEDDNPIVALAAKDLITNKAARRIGLWFEFIFVVLIPVICILVSLYFVLGNYFHLWQTGIQPGQPLTMDNFIFSRIIAGTLSFFGYLFGIQLLVRPMMMLENLESNSSLFRYIPMDPKDLFKGLLKLQFSSFAIYAIFHTIFSLILGIVTAYDTYPMSGMNDNSLIYLYQIFGFVHGVAIIIYMSIISIHTGLHYKTSWGRFIGLIAAILALNVISSAISALFMAIGFDFDYTAGNYNSMFMYYMIAPTITILLFLALSIFLSRSSCVKSLMPKR